MLKEAKSPPDAAQQKLRDNKKTWNTSVSAFINDLIHYKKLMNGHPNKFHMEKGDIKYPIPADAPTIIGSLANDFSEIAQTAAKLTAEQLAYSQNRRKRQSQNMKQTNLPFAGSTTPSTPSEPSTPPSTPDLSKQLSLPLAASEKYDLIVEGSNPVTRFFTRLLTPTMGWSEGARIRKYRMTLLNQCVKTFKDLEKFQLEILKTSPNSIKSASDMLHQSFNDWNVIIKGFSLYYKNISQLTSDDVGGEIPKSKDRVVIKSDEIPKDTSTPLKGEYNYDPKNLDTEQSGKDEQNLFDTMTLAKGIRNDYVAALKNSKIGQIPADQRLLLNDLCEKTILKQDAANKLLAASNLIKSYKNLVRQLNAANNLAEETLSSIITILNKKQIALTEPVAALEATAQKFLKKWIGKIKHHMWADDTSQMRIDIFNSVDDVRLNLDKLMNLIEKGFDVEDMAVIITYIQSKMTELRGITRALKFNAESKEKKPGNLEQLNKSKAG